MKPIQKNNPHRPRQLLRRLSILLLLCALMSLTSCAQPPELDTVKERFVSLIEASAEINDLLWGEGLAYYETDSDYAKEHGIYEGLTQNLGGYRYVTIEALAEYPTVDHIRDAARKVYSMAFLSDVEVSLFDGNMLQTGSISAVSRARYAELNNNLCILADWNHNLRYQKRTYDYDSMQIIRKLSSSEIVTVQIRSSLEDGRDPRDIKLRFVLENGEWFLDTPTY